jgi:glucose-6-phosphate 1-dehydrogenase
MDSFALIIFGITGNLAQIKLIPALYDMAEKGLLPEDMSIIGIARSPLSKDEFRDYFNKILHQENKNHSHDIKPEVVEKMLGSIHYLDGHVDDPNFYPKLNNFLSELSQKGKNCNNRIYYLATYPELYRPIFENLEKNNMNNQEKGWVRLMIEKPIGHDLPSAKALNELLAKYFTEDQIYRLDHYLGKETLQNILTFRFGNGIFESLMNKDHIDHIQITASEDFGIGERGGYFDKVGMLKDVGQNHQLQMLAFATMDEPMEFTNEEVTRQRIKILQNLNPLPDKIIFGQYEGYQNEKNVEPGSKTDTFYAYKTEIINERFKGVPIYVRAGKKLEKTITEVSVVFKVPVNRLFKDDKSGMEPNILIYRIQPNEGIILKILVKKPGHTTELDPSYMQYCYRYSGNDMPDAYEHLIADTIRGDQTFFNDAAEVEAQWTFIDQLTTNDQRPTTYKPGTWGPEEADDLLEADGRHWLEPSDAFCAL